MGLTNTGMRSCNKSEIHATCKNKWEKKKKFFFPLVYSNDSRVGAMSKDSRKDNFTQSTYNP